jgi:hypothetical protein
MSCGLKNILCFEFVFDCDFRLYSYIYFYVFTFGAAAFYSINCISYVSHHSDGSAGYCTMLHAS